jgi:hypothetical protein
MLAVIGSAMGCSRAAAKKLMLMLTFGAAPARGSVIQWRREAEIGDDVELPDFVVQYARETKHARREIVASHPQPWRLRAAARTRVYRDEYRRADGDARLAAIAIQDVEDKALRACEAVHKKHRERVRVLLFDGYFVDLSALTDERKRELENAIYKRTTIRLRVAMKS